jgi:hypothetical protein
MPRWRNWQTLQVEGLLPNGVKVRVLSGALSEKHTAKMLCVFRFDTPYADVFYCFDFSLAHLPKMRPLSKLFFVGYICH